MDDNACVTEVNVLLLNVLLLTELKRDREIILRGMLSFLLLSLILGREYLELGAEKFQLVFVLDYRSFNNG